MDIDREEKFVIDGLTFRMRVVQDDNHREPWKEHEGHGPVSEWTWCEDEWWWVGVAVDLLDVDGTPVPLPDAHASLWGIESDNEDYHMEVAKELATEIAETYKGQNSIPLVIRKV